MAQERRHKKFANMQSISGDVGEVIQPYEKRRLDAIARLINGNMEGKNLEKCTAICFDPYAPGGTPRIIISKNGEKEIKLLREYNEFFAQILKNGELEIEDMKEMFKADIEGLCKLSAGKNATPKQTALVRQDIDKVIESLASNSTRPLNQNIKNALKIGLHLVYKKEKRHAEMKIIDMLIQGAGSVDRFMQKQYYIGISKLCCSGCALVIETLNSKKKPVGVLEDAFLSVRGMHRNSYPGWSLPIFLKLRQFRKNFFAEDELADIVQETKYPEVVIRTADERADQSQSEEDIRNEDEAKLPPQQMHVLEEEQENKRRSEQQKKRRELAELLEKESVKQEKNVKAEQANKQKYQSEHDAENFKRDSAAQQAGQVAKSEQGTIEQDKSRQKGLRPGPAQVEQSAKWRRQLEEARENEEQHLTKADRNKEKRARQQEQKFKRTIEEQERFNKQVEALDVERSESLSDKEKTLMEAIHKEWSRPSGYLASLLEILPEALRLSGSYENKKSKVKKLKQELANISKQQKALSNYQQNRQR